MAQTISQYNEWLKSGKICGNCPMRGRGVFVGADSATETATPQQILFLGLNPGNEEARIGLPFVGPSGRFLRAQLDSVGIGSWAMSNSLLCSTANEADIIQADKARACCHSNLATVFRTFQPQLIVPCGNGAWSLFQVRMAITAATEQVFISRGPTGAAAPVFVLPMFHPSALIRSGGTASAKFTAFMQRLQQIAALASNVTANGINGAMQVLEQRGVKVHPCFSNAQSRIR